MKPNEPRVVIEEVESVLTPAPGVSLEQVLRDAQAAGYQNLTIDRDNNCVVIKWFKRGN